MNPIPSHGTNNIIFILITLSFSSLLHNIDAFSIVGRRTCNRSTRIGGRHSIFNKKTTSIVHGLLDDVMAESISIDNNLNEKRTNNKSDSTTLLTQQAEYEDLFISLIMSQNTKTDILSQLDKCSDASFINYLHTSIEQSNDDEEKQGLKDLINLIEEVQSDVERKKQTLEEERQKKEAMKLQNAGEEGNKSTSMSNADVLKQAFAIDQAGATSSLDDSEKSSDFISDCREVVNLSRGFNNQGQMRVGG